MPNSKPKESYLIHAKFHQIKRQTNQQQNALQLIFYTKKYFYFIQRKYFINVTTQHLKVSRENIEVDNKEIKDY